MRKTRWTKLALACSAALLFPAVSWSATDDAALDLKPEAEGAPKQSADRPLRVFGEFAYGRLNQRYGLGSEDARRASIDVNWAFRIAPQWRGVISDRLDDIHPVDEGSRSTLNSLREAYLGWQSDDARWSFDIGRLNVRNGPAYGFNPTDYFRDGSQRAVTSADPLALRENRLGTVMARVQQLWDGGSVSLVLAPKLRDGPSDKSFSADFGATNHADRALLTVSTRAGDQVSLQGFLFHERHKGVQLGANATAVFGSSTVGFVEWSGGRDNELLSEALGPAPKVVNRQRASLGLTYTTASQVALTAEFEYNGFALKKSEWNQALASTGLEQLGGYLVQVQRRQDIASRKAVLVYASKRDAFVKNLELTGLVRYNVEDHSRFSWVEARYHFNKTDVALQWQVNSGSANTEYGAVPGRSLVQILAAFYF